MNGLNPRTLGLFLASALSLACQAGEYEHAAKTPMPKTYIQECATCHLPYPPGMLPAASWARLMGGLDKHFGTNASIDAKDLEHLRARSISPKQHDEKREVYKLQAGVEFSFAVFPESSAFFQPGE